MADLVLCARYLVSGGVLVVDDFAHPNYPGVAQGVSRFLGERPGWSVLADVNRQGALGRKLYLARDSHRP